MRGGPRFIGAVLNKACVIDPGLTHFVCLHLEFDCPTLVSAFIYFVARLEWPLFSAMVLHCGQQCFLSVYSFIQFYI